jgi:hypothetical protein
MREDDQLVKDWRAKYARHLRNAKARGIVSNLSFEQYMAKIKEGGVILPEQVGRRSDQMQLSRVGDEGAYDVDNCRFITSRQNHQEAFINGRCDNALLRTAEARRGATMETHPYLAEMANKLRGRTKETHEHLAIVSAKTAENQSKDFSIWTPDGINHEGRDLKRFCIERNLNPRGMSRVCRGERKQYRGWTGQWLEPTPDFSGFFHEPEI